MAITTRRATSLRPGQFKHLLRVASVTGRMPVRDVMLLWAHTTGIRVTELALLEVADVLYPSGAVRPEVYLRAEITKGCRARNIHLTHAKCIAAIEAWIAVRLERGWGISCVESYRGLRPDSRLVMTHKGEAFELAFKRRELESGPEVYRACDASTDDQPALPASRYQGWQQPFWQANTGGAGACRDRRRGHCTGDSWPPMPRPQPYLSVDQTVIRRAFEAALG